jgi:hypothetical protein
VRGITSGTPRPTVPSLPEGTTENCLSRSAALGRGLRHAFAASLHPLGEPCLVSGLLRQSGVTNLDDVEIFYSQRNDTLSGQQDAAQKASVTALNNSAQALKTEAELAHKEAEGFKAQIADDDARVKVAEAQVATAKADVADAVAKVATTDARIAEAQRDAARATQQAAQSNEIAERERLARLQLEARLADRTLTTEQQNRLVASLRSSNGITVDVVTYGDTPEISIISHLLIELMQRAGWTIRPVTAMGGQGAVRGILVGTRTGSDAATSAAAMFLIRSLQEANLLLARGHLNRCRGPEHSWAGLASRMTRLSGCLSAASHKTAESNCTSTEILTISSVPCACG